MSVLNIYLGNQFSSYGILIFNIFILIFFLFLDARKEIQSGVGFRVGVGNETKNALRYSYNVVLTLTRNIIISTCKNKVQTKNSFKMRFAVKYILSCYYLCILLVLLFYHAEIKTLSANVTIL